MHPCYPRVVYVLLVVRSHFQSLADDDLAYAPIIATRASTCELLALKLLRHFTESQLELFAVLTHAWNPLKSAPASIVQTVKADLGGDAGALDDPMSALEVRSSRLFRMGPLFVGRSPSLLSRRNFVPHHSYKT